MWKNLKLTIQFSAQVDLGIAGSRDVTQDLFAACGLGGYDP
jgi:hypothetical protein